VQAGQTQFADLQGASFVNAYVIDTDLRAANLDGADFDRAYLDNADLSKATLVGADFGSAYLPGTCFVHSDLRGANLEETERLTNNQLKRAFGDENTKLPQGIDRPSAWTKPIGEQRKDEGFDPHNFGITAGAQCGSS
jgi:uncharacterized protein YjbI with pentapeptide repeats